ncbi:hypothetical protein CONPUDRAFT_148691 [Coniophora puteana RWD-64-598 SS2]|uniref:Uncharacterized protein n=1 Tax=Coniophora puteana (strain RWD-64-598) TaxID=741705 RepID=A0A5M3N5R8_CONPW|nr:uncharacterized protein CONPUDRAFT_148691 [Coniophora puteana RWD-64-598 SS2]EIW86617.1 hypothetical protein CONPUDRAFT_148691 [Coniophora puteana RWD-64-598 SS2]
MSSLATRSIIDYNIDLTDLVTNQQLREAVQYDSIAEGNDVATGPEDLSLEDMATGSPARRPDCFEVIGTDVNLMLPDRPMDLQFSVSDRVPIVFDAQPAELQEYWAKLNDFVQTNDVSVPPQPPIGFEHKGKTYILQSSSNVRQSTEDVLQIGDIVDGVSVFSENTLDLESHQNSTTCKVVCQSTSDEAWNQFLANCDRLSASVPKHGSNDDDESK